MNPEQKGAAAEPFDSNAEGSSSAVDDPRVALVLDEYLAALQAGRRPSREELLGRHPEIREALDRGLEVLEFLHSNAGTGPTRAPGPPDADLLPAGTTLGDYRLVREVGRGGMGVVYEARQVSLGRRVAVKVLSGAGVLDPRRLQRFRIEAQAVAQLNHPRVVPIFAVGSDRGIHYYAMQYVEGSTLAEVLENHPARQRDGAGATTVVRPGSDRGPSSVSAADPSGPGPLPIDPEEGGFRLTSSSAGSGVAPAAGRESFRAIAQLGIQAAEGLDHAHAMGVLHRDIKPSNLLIDARGGLWITDFGLARFQDDSGLTVTGDLVGTLRYMAPELAMGQRMSFDPRSDIYSLGATLYELLTLRPVFAGKDRRELLRQIAQDEPVLPRRIDGTIPRDLETIVLKAMAKEPGRRYASARELADDLARFLDDRPIHARPPAPSERLAKLGRRHWAVLTSAVCVGSAALGIGSALLWQEQQKTARAHGLVESLLLNTLADQLTMSGMERWAATARTPEEHQKLRGFYSQAIGFYEQLARDSTISPRMQALALRRLGFTRMVSRMHGTAGAAEDFRRSIALYGKLLADEPRDAELREGLADVHFNLGIELLFGTDRLGRPNPISGLANAESSFRTAIKLQEALATETRDPALLNHAAANHLQFAAWLEQFGKKDESRRERRAVLDLFERLTGPVLESVQALTQSAGWASTLYRSLAQDLGVRNWSREQEEALRRGLNFQPTDPSLLLSLARLLASRADAGPTRLREAVEVAGKAVGGAPRQPEARRVLALAQLRVCNWSAAAAALDESLKLQAAGKSKGGQASDGLLMAVVRWRQGRRDDARSWYVKALDQMARFPNGDPDASNYWPEAADLLKPVLLTGHLAGDPDR